MAQRHKRCSHARISPNCRACREIQRRWYDKLKARGFEDIEYGLPDGMIAPSPDPTSPGASEGHAFYELVWAVFHKWQSEGRPTRDCRLAELLAAQAGRTGTKRGIAQVLKDEGLAPWSDKYVMRTIKEIRIEIRTIEDTPIETEDYAVPYPIRA